MSDWITSAPVITLKDFYRGMALAGVGNLSIHPTGQEVKDTVEACGAYAEAMMALDQTHDCIGESCDAYRETPEMDIRCADINKSLDDFVGCPRKGTFKELK